jgi:Signal transduction histidine kinase
MPRTLAGGQRIRRWCGGFPGTGRQVGVVRRLIATYLGNRPEVEIAQFIASELVTNALRHTRSGQADGQFRLTLDGRDNLLVIAVTDQGGPSDSPRVCHAGPDDLHGRGLYLVEDMATLWGVYGDRHSRTVWALLHLAPTA